MLKNPMIIKIWLLEGFHPATWSAQSHTGQCKHTGGCYNELVVAFFSTGGGVKGKTRNVTNT